jgi:nitroimidazol reductase NimA-like FMN-containing flavoprotein (pyridoxamine 5'-phosphate oxidase superfamily)
MLVKDIPRADCIELLEHAKLGRLACVHDGEPYVVPMSFEYDGGYLYGVSRRGRRIECMRANPSVCVQLDEIRNRSDWVSLVVHGKYEELPATDNAACARAHHILQRNPAWWEPGCAKTMIDGKELHGEGVFFRIHIDRITGRQGVPDGERKESGLRRWANWISPRSSARQ